MVAFSNPEVSNVEAEAAVCGALLCERSLIDAVADLVTADDFSDEFFGHVFSVILREHSLGRVPTPVTLKPYFDDEGAKVLFSLTGSGVQVMVAKDCARQVAELSKRRRLVERLNEVMTAAHHSDVPVDELVSATEDALSEVDDSAKVEDVSGADCIRAMLNGIGESRSPGVTSGIGSLDATLGPLRPKSLNIIAGRPGMGKTAAAISYALGAAFKGHGVLFISLEVSADDIAERMASDICFDSQLQIPFSAITSGNLSAEQARQVARAAESIDELPLRVLDISAPRVSQLKTLVRRNKRRFAARGHSLDLVIIDYLQLVEADRKTDNRTQDVSEVSRAAKQIAKDNDLAVMALAQLSRKVDDRKPPRPIMSDLRESGQIEQDADAVCFLFSHEYYLMQDEPEASHADRVSWEAAMAEVQGVLEFIVSKRRRGPAGVGRGKFYRQFQAVRG